MDIIEQARKEIDDEFTRIAIDEEKAKLRLKRKSFLKRFLKALTTKKIVIKLENRK